MSSKLIIIIRCQASTQTPAAAISREGEFGALTPGFGADITVLDVLDVEIELEDVHKQIRVRSARSWTAALGEGLNAGRSERLAHTQSAVSHWEAGRGKKKGVLPPLFPGGFGSDSTLATGMAHPLAGRRHHDVLPQEHDRAGLQLERGDEAQQRQVLLNVGTMPYLLAREHCPRGWGHLAGSCKLDRHSPKRLAKQTLLR